MPTLTKILIRKKLVGLEVDQLKQTMEWHALPQRFIDQSIGEWRRRLSASWMKMAETLNTMFH